MVLPLLLFDHRELVDCITGGELLEVSALIRQALEHWLERAVAEVDERYAEQFGRFRFLCWAA